MHYVTLVHISQELLIFKFQGTTYRFTAAGNYTCDSGYYVDPKTISHWKAENNKVYFNHPFHGRPDWNPWQRGQVATPGEEESEQLIMAWADSKKIDDIILGET